MFDDPFYTAINIPLRPRNKNSSLYALMMEWIYLCEAGMALAVATRVCFVCWLIQEHESSITWVGDGLGKGHACELHWFGEKSLNLMEWLGFFKKYFVLNEYLSESIVWFKNTSFVKNIWKFLIRHKCKVISFSHCKGNKNLMIIELYLI